MTQEMHEALKLAGAFSDASFTQGLHQRYEDPAPEKAREALAAKINSMHALIGRLLGSLRSIEGALYVSVDTGRYCLANQFDDGKLTEAIAEATQYLKAKP